MRTQEHSRELEALVSLNEAADLLGLHLQSVLRAIRGGDLVPVRIGRRTLLEPAELRRFIAERRVTPAAGDAP